MRILIVEDEDALAEGLRFNFEQEGYDVVLAGDGPTALERFEDENAPIDLVILDLMLPGMSGYEVCRSIRAMDELVPIIVLSARSLSEDRTQAFDAGTDQYLSKPFALPELLSRVRNRIGRREKSRQAEPAKKAAPQLRTYEFGNVLVDFDAFTVTVGGKSSALTAQELELLRYFIENEGRALSRLRILEDVWDHNPDVTSRTVDNFVMRLRKVIEPDPTQPRHILSLRGMGYRFVSSPSNASDDTGTT
ncbi:MAG: response regulator transcription factor [Planctomycetaceae bacterium]